MPNQKCKESDAEDLFAEFSRAVGGKRKINPQQECAWELLCFTLYHYLSKVLRPRSSGWNLVSFFCHFTFRIMVIKIQLLEDFKKAFLVFLSQMLFFEVNRNIVTKHTKLLQKKKVVWWTLSGYRNRQEGIHSVSHCISNLLSTEAEVAKEGNRVKYLKRSLLLFLALVVETSSCFWTIHFETYWVLSFHICVFGGTILNIQLVSEREMPVPEIQRGSSVCRGITVYFVSFLLR